MEILNKGELQVSDLETFTPGDRGVFYLKRGSRGSLVPHLRGQGLLKLDGSIGCAEAT